MIRFADVHTLLEDDAGELADFLRRYLPLAVSDVWLRPPGHSQIAIAGNGRTSMSLHAPNWPPPPPLRFNSLYWPTGATRWSHCFLLASDAQRLDIEEKLNVRDVQHTTGRLLFAPSDLPQDDYAELADLLGFSSSKHALGVDMFLLSPRPVPVSLENEERLWILPLVDERYYWQYHHASLNFVPETWPEAFSILLNTLHERHANPEEHYEIPDSVHESYGDPVLRTDVSNLFYIAADVLLDTVAFQTGHRVVRKFDGTTVVQTISAAEELLASNQNGLREIAGGDMEWLRSIIPHNLTLYFSDIAKVRVPGVDDLEQSEVVADTPTTGQMFLIPSHDEAEIDIDDLSQQFAEDFYRWIVKRYDRTFTGIHNWEPTGFEDCIEIAWGSHLAPGDLLAHMRVRTLPYNWHPATLIYALNGERCAYYHEFTVVGVPTGGSQVWGYRILGVEADITVEGTQAAGPFKTHFLAQFPALGTDDLDVLEAPLPQRALLVKFGERIADNVAREWLNGYPTVEASTLDEGASMHVRPINPRTPETTTTTTTTTTTA